MFIKCLCTSHCAEYWAFRGEQDCSPGNYGIMGNTGVHSTTLQQDFSRKSNANSYYLPSIYHMSSTALSPSFVFLLNPHCNLQGGGGMGTVIILIVLMRKLRSETLNDLPKRLLMEGATPMGLGSPGGLLGGNSK